jgi:hypothetical protein
MRQPAPTQLLPRDTFKSADGSTRCVGCHLFPDTCTCRPDHPMRVIFGQVFECVALAKTQQ